jgi:hypothetical protein
LIGKAQAKFFSISKRERKKKILTSNLGLRNKLSRLNKKKNKKAKLARR